MFMRPNVVQETFSEYENNEGTWVIPAWVVPDDAILSPFEHVAEHDKKWFARLSAPGYMDCTDWMGPFDNESEALKELFDFYATDDETLEEWKEEVF